MIFSAQQLFSDDQVVTATAVSTNVIDLGVAGTPYLGNSPLNQDQGKGNEVPILIQVTEDFATLTSLDITIEVGPTTALGTVLVSESVLAADLVAGKQTNTRVLPNGADQRYLGVRYTVVGAAATAGMITSGIVMGVQTNITGG